MRGDITTHSNDRKKIREYCNFIGINLIIGKALERHTAKAHSRKNRFFKKKK